MRQCSTLKVKKNQGINFDFALRKFRFMYISRNKENNLWDNPPKASKGMSEIFKEYKHTFKESDQWDGDFVL